MAGTPLAVGQIVRASAWCTSAAQASVNSWYYQISAVSSPTPATDQDLAQAVDAAIEALMKAYLPNIANYMGIQAQIVTPGPLPNAVAYTVNEGAGTEGGTVLPMQACGLNTWRTGLATPKFRGRTFWPFPSVDWDTGNGKPTGGHTVAVGNICAALLGLTTFSISGRSATMQMVLYHRATKTGTPITSYIVRTYWANQIRRAADSRQNVSPIG